MEGGEDEGMSYQRQIRFVDKIIQLSLQDCLYQAVKQLARGCDLFC